MTEDFQMWRDYAEAFAFVGNSLLAPVSQTSAVTLSAAFWDDLPDFGEDGIKQAIEDCRGYAEGVSALDRADEDVARRASVEYTQLFIGPPKPAAAPWETIYSGTGAQVGFGEATFEMRRLLREAGLEVSNENNQYADHIGIELLFAATLCERLAQVEGDGTILRAQIVDYVNAHPLAWIDKLVDACEKAAPGGFVVRMIRLAKSLLVGVLHVASL